MKKVLLFFLVFAFVFFWGCEFYNNPVEPETALNEKFAISSMEGEPDLTGYVKINPEAFFLKIIKGMVERGDGEFTKPNHRKAFINKINAVINMLDIENPALPRGNIKGAINKIESDILPALEKWVVEVDCSYSCKSKNLSTGYYLWGCARLHKGQLCSA